MKYFKTIVALLIFGTVSICLAGANSELVKSYCKTIPEDDYPKTRGNCFILSNANYNQQLVNFVASRTSFDRNPMYFTEKLEKVQNKKFDKDVLSLVIQRTRLESELWATIEKIANKQYSPLDKETCNNNLDCLLSRGVSIVEEPSY